MNTPNELAQVLLNLFGMSETGAAIVGVVAIILSGIWVLARKAMRKSENTATREHNRSEASRRVPDTRDDNQSASDEWEDAEDMIKTRMRRLGEGTKEQPLEEYDEGGE